MTTTPEPAALPTAETLGSFEAAGLSLTFEGLSETDAARHFAALHPWALEQAARHNVRLEPCWHLHMAVLDTLLPLMFRDLHTRSAEHDRSLGLARSRYVEELYVALGRVARLLEPCGNIWRAQDVEGEQPWWAEAYPAHRVTRMPKQGTMPPNGVPGALVREA